MSTYKRKTPRQYNREFKIEAVKLSGEIGRAKASSELGIPEGTIYGWIKDPIYNTVLEEKESKTAESILTLAEENKQLKAEIKAISKANALLRKENAFLEEANAFFAASRQKLAKERE